VIGGLGGVNPTLQFMLNPNPVMLNPNPDPGSPGRNKFKGRIIKIINNIIPGVCGVWVVLGWCYEFRGVLGPPAVQGANRCGIASGAGVAIRSRFAGLFE